jgi:very-short-patch-repair endonuclease
MDARSHDLLAAQADVVAAWQLLALGWRRPQIDRRAYSERWQGVHPGVYALIRAPLTRRQRWIAATLSAPHTFLYAASAAACWGFREWEGAFETVVRPGSGGRRRMGSLLVARSSMLAGATTTHDSIAITTAPRTLVDLAPHLPQWELGRAFREACRLKTTTANEISRALAGQRGTRVLADRCDRYATIPYHRCRSDAECRALEVLHDAGVPAPEVNVQVGRSGPEADLVWRPWKLIVEIDGGQFHQFPDEDARKEAIWRRAGYEVRRLPSDDVYFRPERLVMVANVHSIPT